MGGKCSFVKNDIISEQSSNQNIKTLIEKEIPINQPSNSIVPKLLPNNSPIQELLQIEAMEVDDNQILIDNSLISSCDGKIKLKDIIYCLKENYKDIKEIKKSKSKSRTKKKRITMEDLEQIF